MTEAELTDFVERTFYDAANAPRLFWLVSDQWGLRVTEHKPRDSRDVVLALTAGQADDLVQKLIDTLEEAA